MLALKKLMKSFAFAYQGLKISIREEQNLRIEIFFGIISISMGFYFHLTQFEWMILVLTIALVIGAEIFNTALESIGKHCRFSFARNKSFSSESEGRRRCRGFNIFFYGRHHRYYYFRASIIRSQSFLKFG